MYARYNTLFNGCVMTPFTGITDSTRFSCGSLPQQPLVRRSIQSEERSPSEIQCLHDCQETNEQCRYDCRVGPVREEFSLPKKTPITTTKLPSFSAVHTQMLPQKTTIEKKPIDPKNLLPVMDPKFNLREICKQSILLEDHLSHTEKRCVDCCIKHFLTLEALAEEAITLDKDKQFRDSIKDLPLRIRQLQNRWYEDPDNNAHEVSQKLRAIRKQYQIDCFDIVFQNSCDDCSDSICRIKKK